MNASQPRPKRRGATARLSFEEPMTVLQGRLEGASQAAAVEVTQRRDEPLPLYATLDGVRVVVLDAREYHQLRAAALRPPAAEARLKIRAPCARKPLP